MGPALSKVQFVILEKIPEIRQLSAEEKLMLLTELWDELTLNPDEVTLTPDQEDLLDQRWRDYQKDPSQVPEPGSSEALCVCRHDRISGRGPV